MWIVLAAALLMAIMLIQIWRGWSRYIHAELEKDSMQVLDNTILRVNGILEDAELAAGNTHWLIERDINQPSAMVPYAEQTVQNNPVLSSCSISFEPDFYPGKGHYYSIFAFRDTMTGTVRWEQEGSDEYVYHDREWYKLPKLLNRPCWTEPYSDLTADELSAMDTVLVSYCMPIHTRNGRYAGSFSVDISLRWLSETLLSVKPYPHAFCIMIGRRGRYLVHPDQDKLFYQNFYTEHQDIPGVYELENSIRQKETGHRALMLNGEKCYIFYAPLQTTGWTVAIICPEKDILGGLQKTRALMFLNILVSLLVMFFVFGWLIRRQISPLSQLAVSADRIASGNLDYPLEPARRKDEIGVLTDSFRNMQSSLVRHIQELTAATASRERFERELQIARNIQMGMVPHDFPSREDFDLYASMVPAREVGGDLYDFFIQNDKLYVCIGDVSGKGIPASLIMAVTRGMFRIVARQELPPAEIARRINDALAEENQEMLFVTMFFACIDLKTGVMEFCNCGHNLPVLFSGDGSKPRFLDCIPNTVIGVMPGFEFEGQRVDDVRGKVLFIYTDGLNEAENAAHEQFGNEAMLEELGRKAFTDSRSLIERMGDAVARHVNGAEASDDLTMICVKFNS
jgi:sigma-B regulation protein RsbU (phosphoserine phosphatase)